MANNQAVMGLLEELGLQGIDENEIWKQAQQGQGGGSSGGSFAAVMHNVGRELGQNVAPAVGGAVQMAKNKSLNFSQGVRDVKDQTVAAKMGLSGKEELRSRRTTQQEASQVKVTPTGDPIADQQEALKQIIAIANKNGDAGTVTKALQKQTKLQAQAQEFAKQETSNKKSALEQEVREEKDSTGHTVYLPGDDLDGPISKAVHIDEGEDQGKWRVIRPDGKEQIVDGAKLIFMDPARKARDRQFETDDGTMMTDLKLNGYTGQAIQKPRNHLEDMGTQATIVNDMTNSLLDMYNPEIAFSDSSSAAVAADRAVSFVDTVSSLFTRNGKEEGDITYDGKKVSGDLQYREATKTSLYDEFLADSNMTIRDILPDHIQADTQEAQLFMANVMQLAYLDARLQEPANRGLSDSDIKAALKRIGAGSPDPMVFARRQKQNLGRLQNKMDNLGIELSTPSADRTQRLKNHIYTPASRSKVQRHLSEADSRLDQFIAGRTQAAQVQQEFEGMTNEQMDAEIARLEEEERQQGTP